MKRERNDSADAVTNKKFKKGKKKNIGMQSKHKSTNKKKKVSKYEKSTLKVKSEVPNKQKSSKFHKKKKPNMDVAKHVKKPNMDIAKHVKKPNMDVEKTIKKNKDEQETPSEKPNWLEYKKQQKELREKRRAKKLEDSYDIAIKAKQIGEKLRRSNLSPEIKEKLTKNLYDAIQDQYSKLIYTHDLSRVIQWQLKYCSSDIELEIVEKLKPHLLEMCYSKYAKNIIKTLLKKGTDHVKKIILQQCNGHVVKLLSSVISAPIFEKIYVEIASSAEKIAFKQELYSDIYKKSKDPEVKTLTDAYKNAEDMKVATLSSVKMNLTRILNKNLINSTLVHTVLYEYMTSCSKEDRAEIILLIRPIISELSQTKDGAKAANLCIWHGTNKDRKLIMKALKEHVKDIMTSEHGHLLILALLDSVDDTILLKKIILQEMLNNLSEIIANEYGKRVISYLVARRDTHYFHPKLIEYLKEGDRNATSKKPAEIREKELLDSVIDNFLESIKTDVKIWLSKGSVQLVTLAILKACPGDKAKPVLDAISKFITDVNEKLENEKQSFEVVEEPGLHLMLKKLIQMDSKRLEQNELTFGEVLLEYLNTKVLEHWINYNRGCFLLITLLKNESENVVSKLKSELQKISNLKSKTSVGASILLTKLN